MVFDLEQVKAAFKEEFIIHTLGNWVIKSLCELLRDGSKDSKAFSKLLYESFRIKLWGK